MNQSLIEPKDIAAGAILIAQYLRIYTDSFAHETNPWVVSNRLFGQIGSMAYAVFYLGECLARNEFHLPLVEELRHKLRSQGWVSVK